MSRSVRRSASLLAWVTISGLVAAWPSSTMVQTAAGNDASIGPRVDSAARGVLSRTGVPSASVAVVQNGKIAYVQAYGEARLDPPAPARPAMRYSIGSISKQFTATAVLMLCEEGKLSLDDKVGKFLPDLTRANEVTVRELLSHTSGYQDYWPQDYVPPFMLQPMTPQGILDRWARKPLDFEPGTTWQYSNTNYVIAGLIVEKASGMPLLPFLQQRVFTPLAMTSVQNIDQEKLTDGDPTGYMRYGLGPLRVAPKEGRGWLFAASELAMQAEDLARWDISMIEQKLVKPASYAEMEREAVTKSGVGTQYGLGVTVRYDAGRRVIEHGGEVSGFTAENVVYPDDRAAIVVLTNQDAASAAGDIGRAIAPIIFAPSGGAEAATDERTRRARSILDGLQRGTIDRSQLAENANGYFSDLALADFASGLAPLGPLQAFSRTGQSLRGGMTLRVYRAQFATKVLRVWTYELPDGRLEQYQVAAQ